MKKKNKSTKPQYEEVDPKTQLKDINQGDFMMASQKYPDVQITIQICANDRANVIFIFKDNFSGTSLDILKKEITALTSGKLCRIVMRYEADTKEKFIKIYLIFNGITFEEITKQIHSYLEDLFQKVTNHYLTSAIISV